MASAERGRIVQAEIETLAGDRVDHVGGVAQERQALATKERATPKDERVGVRLGLEGDAAELQAEAALEFGQKVLGIGFEQTRHVVACARSRRWRSGAARCRRLNLGFSGRIAKGPEGRKCSTARPP